MLSMNQKDESTVKFERLLDSARIQSNPSLEINSANELTQDILDFIFNNVKISNVIEELSDSEDASWAKDLTQMTENVYIEHLQVIADTTDTPIQFVASQIFAEQLCEVTSIEHNQNITRRCHHLLSKKLKEKVKALLNIITKMNATKCFDKVNFIKTLQKSNIPVEVIWLLNENSVLSFRSCFLSWYKEKNWLKIFSESIVCLSWHGDQEDVFHRRKILEVFLGDLLLIGYGEAPESQDIVEKTRQFLFEVTENNEKRSENLTSEEMKNWLCLLEVIRELKDVPVEIISKFFHEILSEFLSKPFTDKITIQNAIACQNEWTFEFLNETSKRKYLQFVMMFRGVEFIQVLQHAVESFMLEPVNIKVLCHLTTVYLVHNEEPYKLFDDFLAQSLSECFQSCNISQFHLILLLRRQAALEGNHICPSYSSWFEQTFVGKGSCLGMNTKKAIHFFFKSLTELVPYEKPDILRVHIFRSPQIASKFKSYVDDYVSLAKTRLADMNETLEDNTGLFSHSASNEEKAKAMNLARDDVEKCVILYEQSGKIPTAIVEASIFRKPYFIGRFLPALLVRRDPLLEADSKTRLIEDLERAGKIPAAMLRSYKRRCEQVEGSSNDDKTRDDIQQLSDCLDQLPDLLIKIATVDDDTEALLQWLSRVTRKLKLVFGANPQESAVGILRLDEAALNLDSTCLQASYVVINSFCRACVAVQNTTTSENVASNSALTKSRWASKFVSIIVSFPRLVQTLFVHLWSTIFHEPHLLSDEHIHGLATFICHLSCFQTGYKICLKNELHETFVGFIASEISLSSRNCANFFLRWSCCYIQYALVFSESITTDPNQLSTNGLCFVPEIMLLKIEYLFNKLKFKSGDRNHALALQNNEMDILTVLMKSLYKIGLLNEQLSLTFKQWLVWELRIQEDMLQDDERLQYYNWRIYEKFLTCSESDDTGYGKMAAEIVSCLLDHWTSASQTPSSTQMTVIKILQNIVGLMNSSSSEAKDGDQVWFLECFISRFEKIKQDENPSNQIHIRCEVLAFVRLATSLPPWLLISNFETESTNISDEKLKKLSDFLNENLKPSLFQRSLVLPFDFTTHIFKIFLKYSRQEYVKERKQEEIFWSFIIETPSVLASLISYWNQLKPIYYHRVTSSGTLDQLQTYHAWLTNIFTEKRSEQYQFPPDFVNCEIGQSYAIFLHLLKRAQSFASKMEEFVPRLNNMIDSLLPLQSGKKIIVHLFDNIMAYLAGTALEQFKTIDGTEKFWVDVSTAILFRCPQVLCVFSQKVSQDIPVRRILFETTTYRLLSVVFFRIITCQERDVLQQKLAVQPFTQTVLLMYIECVDLYQNYSDSTLSKQPMDVDTFVKITIFVKDFLRHTSTVVLRQTPELVFARLPKDIQRYVSR